MSSGHKEHTNSMELFDTLDDVHTRVGEDGSA